MSFAEWIHCQRAKHQRRMARAQSYVEHAQYLVRKGDGVKGWYHMSLAIKEVAECGCDRSLWRPSVREAIHGGNPQ